MAAKTAAGVAGALKVENPANLLSLDRAIRQQIYHLSFALVYEKDVRRNKERFLYDIYRQHDYLERDEVQMPSCEEWARELGSVHEKISEELPYVVNKIKKELDQGFADFSPVGRLHHWLGCGRGDCEFCMLEDGAENRSHPIEHSPEQQLKWLMEYTEHKNGSCHSLDWLVF